jgi:hypothetical protein
LTNRRSDVPAKQAFIEALAERGFRAKVTSAPADITAEYAGERYYFEIKFTNQASRYFGAATLTEWEAALGHANHFFFVTAQQHPSGWVFHEYTPDEFMAFSTIPPFKVFFQIPVGASRAVLPPPARSRTVRLTRNRVERMVELYSRWRNGDDG